LAVWVDVGVLRALYKGTPPLLHPGFSTSASMDSGAPTLGLRTHAGGCHCGAVRFEFDAPADLVAWDCNCSICAMKRNVHTMVVVARFRLLTPAAAITEYRFGTGVARHRFCAVCGVQAFYHPRSNPDCVAVTVACISSGSVRSVTTVPYDGRNWERAHAETGIAACSEG
jgi:hypothetical protein